MRKLKHRLMINGCFHGLLVWGLVCCFAGIKLNCAAQTYENEKPDSSGFILIPPHGEDWTRHFHFGAMVGLNINASFNEQGLFNVPADNVANGIYDDGYVRQDQTGNAGGYTSYWGYDNASQYNAAAQTLTMHSITSYSTSGGGSVNGDPFPGFDLAYGDDYLYWKYAHVRIGWELGFDLLPINITDNHPLSATVNQAVYIYHTGGIVVPEPPPYESGSSGPASLLSTSHDPVVTQSLPVGMITGSHTLDVMLYTVRLGPNFFWDLSPNVGLSLSAGPVIGYASAQYKYSEIITTANSSIHEGGGFEAGDVIYGGYVNATLKYHVVDNGRDAYLYIGAQYMPMESANFNRGGRAAQLNLDGQLYFMAGIGWPF